MPVQEIPPLPRPIASNNASANNTEWVNHMTHRRVTEIPEQFAQ
jgi:hypothetical protein